MNREITLSTPYQENVVQYYRILIQPRHMNTKIEDNITTILKNEVQKRCNKDCYIDNVRGILNYNECDMNAENLSGAALYDIEYLCDIYLPIERTFIIAKVLSISSEEIFLENGPLLISSRLSLIKNENWRREGSQIYNNNKEKYLQVDDYVSIYVIGKKINNGETQIMVLGIIHDYVSDKDIEKYYGQKIINDKDNNNDSDEETKDDSDNFIL